MLLEKKAVSKRKMAFFTLACRFLHSLFCCISPLKIANMTAARMSRAIHCAPQAASSAANTVRKQRSQSASNATENSINTAPQHEFSLGEPAEPGGRRELGGEVLYACQPNSRSGKPPENDHCFICDLRPVRCP